MKNNLKSPCNECPFRNNSIKGYLGGRWTAESLHKFVMQEGNFGCHKTIQADNQAQEETEHCVGSVLYMSKNAKRCSYNKELAELQEKFRDADKSNILNLVELQEHHKGAVVTRSVELISILKNQ